MAEHMGINLLYYISSPRRIFEFSQRRKSCPLPLFEARYSLYTASCLRS